MHSLQHLATGLKLTTRLFIGSLVLISILGACFGYYGMTTPHKYPATRPHDDVTFPSHATDHKQLSGWFFRANTPTVVVVVHGWSGNRARLTPLAEQLNAAGHNVLTFDLRGGTGQNTYGQREAEDLAGAVAWLQTQGFQPETIAVVGNSIGGAASTIYAASHPLRSLVLISPVLDIPTTKRTALRNSHFIAPGLYAFGSSLIERIFFGVHPANPATVLASIQMPTLLLHGTADDLAPIETVYAVQQALPADSPIRVQIIDGASHTFIDEDMQGTQVYTRLITEFLANEIARGPVLP